MFADRLVFRAIRVVASFGGAFALAQLLGRLLGGIGGSSYHCRGREARREGREGMWSAELKRMERRDEMGKRKRKGRGQNCREKRLWPLFPSSDRLPIVSRERRGSQSSHLWSQDSLGTELCRLGELVEGGRIWPDRPPVLAGERGSTRFCQFWLFSPSRKSQRRPDPAMVRLPALSRMGTTAAPSFKSPHQRPVTKVVFSYCPYWLSSNSLRTFISKNVEQLARTHPSVEFVVKQRLYKHGFVQGIYSELVYCSRGRLWPR
jgi:hypothetical protein